MGYDIERFVEPPKEGLLCSICRDVLEDPLQGPCEHVYCSACIYGWLVHNNSCPDDRHVLYPSDLHPIFRYMKNDLEALLVRCKNKEAGCSFLGKLSTLRGHELECGFETVHCSSQGCRMQVSKMALQEHLQNCPFHTKECPKGCGLMILDADDVNHNCIAELRNTMELLRSELICKMEEERTELVRMHQEHTEDMLQSFKLKEKEINQKESALFAQLSSVQSQMMTIQLELEQVKRAVQSKGETKELTLKRCSTKMTTL